MIRLTWWIGAASLCLLLSSGCSSPERRAPCPRRAPAFRLQLTAEGGDLPPDTRIDVLYGGNQEGTYSIASGIGRNDDVCCVIGTPTAGALPHVPCVESSLPDGGGAAAILCELWTDGAAEVVVTASGYAGLDRTLAPVVNNPGCGVDTVDQHLLLSRGDGGR